MKRVLLFVLVAVMLTACLAPMAMAETPEGTPGPEDMRGFGEIARPRKDCWLSAYETRYVQSSGGVAAFLFKAPDLEADKLDPVLEGEELLLLAKQGDFYLAKLSRHRLGWICVGQTAEDTALLDSVPDLKEGVWVYKRGPEAGEKDTFAIDFTTDRMMKIVRVSDGAQLPQSWVLSGRRVWLDNRYFIWDGEQFVSRDTYPSSSGPVHYTLSLDAAGTYKDLF